MPLFFLHKDQEAEGLDEYLGWMRADVGGGQAELAGFRVFRGVSDGLRRGTGQGGLPYPSDLRNGSDSLQKLQVTASFDSQLSFLLLFEILEASQVMLND